MSKLNMPLFMMNIPTSYSTDIKNNVWMDEYDDNEIIVNKEKAIRELWEVYSFLSNQGFVYLLPTPADCKLQDLVFVANNGIVLEHVDEPTYIGANFRASNRIGEEVLGMSFFNSLGYKTIKCPYFFEGEAELKHLRDNIYIGGYGMRSQKESYEWMEKEFGMKVIPLELTDPYNYHLDCTVFPLTRDKVIIATDAYTKNELKLVEKVAEIIPITIDQAHTGLTNSVRVNNYLLNASDIDFLSKRSEDYRLESSKNFRLEQIAGENCMEVVYFNMEEFMKGGALLSCCVLHVNRHSYTKELI